LVAVATTTTAAICVIRWVPTAYVTFDSFSHCKTMKPVTELDKMQHLTLYVTGKWVAVLLHISRVMSSNIGIETRYPDRIFRISFSPVRHMPSSLPSPPPPAIHLVKKAVFYAVLSRSQNTLVWMMIWYSESHSVTGQNF
jgi:hypothetical protein